ncbi:ABC transporter ATP-binding protein [Propylenella binzhouense]|uniref:ABC transporter ATP-binding protein n=1 Tax=Propylenella binzhouense TaxID=2555902 RepID=A0A964T133_9HYPH|nr:ABC transporter ATP-binding protein [Propylenella binzhouense]MYZ46411.1 ABC transporter ATP-binding protein [Propylenella binzhouense]
MLKSGPSSGELGGSAPVAAARAGLEVANAQIFYDSHVEAVRDISFAVPPGQIVCLLGSNGAGKSTTLKAISGILFPEKGMLVSGSITYDGRRIDRVEADEVVRGGVVLVPEGRRLFINLTVEENLLVGGISRSAADRRAQLERVYDQFPELPEHRHRISGYLSGGQQQMVAIGRALMSNPTLLMLDEPSLGLAPKIVDSIFEAIVQLRSNDMSVLLVEQNAHLALSVADFGYVMERGRIVFDGSANDLMESPEIQEFYLGMNASKQRKSLRHVKHYKRRKRWLS